MVDKEQRQEDEKKVSEIYLFIVKNLTHLPKDTMSSKRCPGWMYAATLRLIKSFCISIGITKDQLMEDIDKHVWPDEKGEVLFEDKVYKGL